MYNPNNTNLNSLSSNTQNIPIPNPTHLDLLELALQVRKESKEFLEVGKQFCEWIKSK
jgi:hypothetical protein